VVHPGQVDRLGHCEVVGVLGLEGLEIGGHKLARVQAVDHLGARAGKIDVEFGKEAAVFQQSCGLLAGSGTSLKR
jgi:hypothetical protein